ncbi:MAG: hypothetical protein DRI86_12080 [Bacteroidetes bacterium]|nr:MAG: hypothetical protein DRI86_12080 [Bacteroidota bacterium]
MLKGIKQPNLTTRTTKLPGTELPTVQHSSNITGNKDVGNVVRNMTSTFKNPFMGQRAVMTNTKNHNHNQVKTSLPAIKTGFEPKKILESSEWPDMRKSLILETKTLHNVIDHGIQNGVRVHSGGKDLGSGTKKEQTRAINDPVASPRKPLKNETLGIQNMPQKKKNQGLNYLSKLDTQKRQQGIIQ